MIHKCKIKSKIQVDFVNQINLEAKIMIYETFCNEDNEFILGILDPSQNQIS